jgi:hypothetical protein
VVIGKILASLQANSQSGTLTPTLANPLETYLGTIFCLFKMNV